MRESEGTSLALGDTSDNICASQLQSVVGQSYSVFHRDTTTPSPVLVVRPTAPAVRLRRSEDTIPRHILIRCLCARYVNVLLEDLCKSGGNPDHSKDAFGNLDWRRPTEQSTRYCVGTREHLHLPA